MGRGKYKERLSRMGFEEKREEKGEKVKHQTGVELEDKKMSPGTG